MIGNAASASSKPASAGSEYRGFESWMTSTLTSPDFMASISFCSSSRAIRLDAGVGGGGVAAQLMRFIAAIQNVDRVLLLQFHPDEKERQVRKMDILRKEKESAQEKLRSFRMEKT